MEAEKPLSEIVANRRWSRRLLPFPHLVVPDLFVESVAAEIDEAVRKLAADESLARIGSYDASGWGFPPDVEWPLRLFVTPAWCDLISRVLGVETVPYVSAGMHHHAIGGKNGKPHNDLNPVYFADVEPIDGIVSLRGDLVDMKSGKRYRRKAPRVRHVRAVSMLYYTANGEWREGHGGETGLYERQSDPVNRPTAAVPPVNNTLLAFECTPNSYHSFISNRVAERNSVIMWLHRSDEMAVNRWGEDTLERWAESPPPRKQELG